MTRLQIATNFTLPREAVTQTFAYLSKRGGGKTYTAGVVAEEMLGNEAHVCVLDPVGVWWGLRAPAKGLDSLPFEPPYVIGGEHGDLPLTPDSGAEIAQFVVDGANAIVDTSLLRKGARTRFNIDFTEELYHRNREALHVFFEEADEIAPQRTWGADEPQMLGAVEDIIRRGRSRGLGASLISQRSAVLNKNVLTQIEVLVAGRTIAPQDIAAIMEWVKYHGEEKKKEKFLSTLASLPIEVKWFWSPGWLGVLKQIQVRPKLTFDSSDTPEVGKVTRKPKGFAEVDLKALQERLATVAAKAKQTDPKALRLRVAELQAENLRLQHETKKPVPPVNVTKTVEKVVEVKVPILRDGDLARVDAIGSQIKGLGERFEAFRSGLLEKVAKRVPAKPDVPFLARLPPSMRPIHPTPTKVPRTIPARVAEPRPANPPPGDVASQVTPSLKKLLQALVDMEAIGISAPSRDQLAAWINESPGAGSFNNKLGALNNKLRLVHYPGRGKIAITDAGRTFAELANPPSSLQEFHSRIFAKVGPSRANILRALIAIYPDPVRRETLAEKVDESPTAGSFNNKLGWLHNSMRLIDYSSDDPSMEPGFVRASASLFPPLPVSA